MPQFFGRNGEEFIVNRGDLQRLNYNKTVIGRDLARTPLGELTTLYLTPSRMGGDTLPHSPPLSSRDPRAPRSPSELVSKVTPLSILYKKYHTRFWSLLSMDTPDRNLWHRWTDKRGNFPDISIDVLYYSVVITVSCYVCVGFVHYFAGRTCSLDTIAH